MLASKLVRGQHIALASKLDPAWSLIREESVRFVDEGAYLRQDSAAVFALGEIFERCCCVGNIPVTIAGLRGGRKSISCMVNRRHTGARLVGRLGGGWGVHVCKVASRFAVSLGRAFEQMKGVLTFHLFGGGPPQRENPDVP